MRTEYYLWWWAFISRFNDDAPGDTINGLRFTEAGLWIRIRMDPRSFSLLDPDPHSVIQYANPESGGKNLREKIEKMQGKWKKIVILLLNIN